MDAPKVFLENIVKFSCFIIFESWHAFVSLGNLLTKGPLGPSQKSPNNLFIDNLFNNLFYYGITSRPGLLADLCFMGTTWVYLAYIFAFFHIFSIFHRLDTTFMKTTIEWHNVKKTFFTIINTNVRHFRQKCQKRADDVCERDVLFYLFMEHEFDSV